MTLRETSGARELNVDADFVRLIVVKARAALFPMPDAEEDAPEKTLEIDAATEVDGADPAALSEEDGSDAARDEVAAMIDSLNVDEQAEVTALTLIGRGDYEPAEFELAVRAAKAEAGGPASEVLLEMDLFPSHLENGLESYENWAAGQPG